MSESNKSLVVHLGRSGHINCTYGKPFIPLIILLLMLGM